MKFSELPQNYQDKLMEERKNLHNSWKTNNAYHILFVNEAGTRYFSADRVAEPWGDDKGHYMAFGGGSHWRISYGKIGWDYNKIMGEFSEVYWCKSNTAFGKSANGVIIPSVLSKKAEVLELVKKLEIFNSSF